MPAPNLTGAGREFFQEAQRSEVEARQDLIREYQEEHGCRLIVKLGQISRMMSRHSRTYFPLLNQRRIFTSY